MIGSDTYYEVEGIRLYRSGFRPEDVTDIKPKVIVQVGAQDGGDAVWMNKTFPEASVYCFEASPNMFSKILTYADKFPRISFVNKAVSNYDGETDFYEVFDGAKKEWVGCSSMLKRTERHKNTFWGLTHLEPIKIPCVMLSTFCKENSIAHIDILHIDVEGAELMVLEGLGELRPDIIYLEWGYGSEFYEGGYSKDGISKRMQELEYDEVGNSGVDAVFRKRK
jgi:FkbM family methyltransferase